MTTHDAASPFDLASDVRAWIADDPDPATAAELERVLAEALQPAPGGASLAAQTIRARITVARDDLADRFSGPLLFGTAGLRGVLGGGPHRMNRAVVIRTAAGLAAHLNHTLTEAVPRVVIGYDARHNSAVFARDTAAVMVGAGIEALLLPSALPTPVLAFAVRHLDADAGVMVTASHNPPRDNGYKVYLGGRMAAESGRGVQIVPPSDAEIAARISEVTTVAAVPRAETGWTVLGPEVLDDYVSGVVSLADPTGPRALRIVHTSMHGVGGAVAERVLREAGFTDVRVVPEQADPDPDFPTVAFPNPEEPGAIDLALGLAQDSGADLVIANDPDADRCAIAVLDPRARIFRGPDTAGADGWRMLHGDEVGALLGAYVADRAGHGRRPGSTGTTGDLVLANSIVSSRLLARIAASHGMAHAATLTGFKWIARVDGLLFGYEEAIGYCVDPARVRDKDGLSAGLLMAELAAGLKSAGRTLIDALDDLAREHGLYLTDQLAARFTDLDQIPATMARVRANPPATLAGSPVTEVVDLAEGTADLPPTDGLRLLAQDGTRVIVRPSGTEPKVKCYLEVIVPVAPEADHAALTHTRAIARARLDAVKDDLKVALGLA